MPTSKKMASFRVERDIYDSFTEWCQLHDTTLTDELTGFMKLRVQGFLDEIMPIQKESSALSQLEQLQKQLSALEEEVRRIKQQRVA